MDLAPSRQPLASPLLFAGVDPAHDEGLPGTGQWARPRGGRGGRPRAPAASFPIPDSPVAKASSCYPLLARASRTHSHESSVSCPTRTPDRAGDGRGSVDPGGPPINRRAPGAGRGAACQGSLARAHFAPNDVEELVFRDEPTRVLDEMAQDRKRFRRQPQAPSAAPRRFVLRLDAHRENVSGGCFPHRAPSSLPEYSLSNP